MKRPAENVDAPARTVARVHIVRCAAQAGSDDLFAEKLTGERAQAHDVSQGLGDPPALGKHPDGDHVLYLLALNLPGRLEKTAEEQSFPYRPSRKLQKNSCLNPGTLP